jgi:GH24 family phage-related lysozyme (muramidase)
MARIPVPDQINPRAIAGDRLAMQAPDLSAPARALQGLGSALSGLAERYQADKNKMDAYNTNLQLEKFTTDQTIGYQQDLDTSAPDGSDFLAKREKGLTEGYQKIRAGIKDPELGAKADLVFEQLRGNQLVKGTQDVKQKQTSYVLATTNESVSNIIQSGALDSKEQFDDYYENVIKPRIGSVITDPLQRQKMETTFGQQLREEYFRLHPEAIIDRSQPAASGGDALSKSASLLRKFEGFRETTYWDVTAHRTGYGSDTITKADGSVVRVQKGMRVSRADAERDLTRRTKEFQKQAASDVGESWGKFNPDQQAALTSVAYNYGSLPKRVINAARTGDPEAVARAVESLADHNAGVNRKRREEEAAVIRGGVSVPGGTSVSYSMPEKPKGGIFEYMDDKSWNDAVKSGQAAFRDSLDLGIEQGEVTRPDIEMAPIEDSDKADLLRRWDKRNEDQGNLAGFVERLGSGGFVNAKDAKDRKAAGMLLNPAAIAASDPDAVAAMYDLYRKSGIVPDNSKGALESMLRSRDAWLV